MSIETPLVNFCNKSLNPKIYIILIKISPFFYEIKDGSFFVYKNKCFYYLERDLFIWYMTQILKLKINILYKRYTSLNRKSKFWHKGWHDIHLFTITCGMWPEIYVQNETVLGFFLNLIHHDLKKLKTNHKYNIKLKNFNIDLATGNG